MTSYECPKCWLTYPSPLATELCGEDDREQDRYARQELRGRVKQ